MNPGQEKARRATSASPVSPGTVPGVILGTARGVSSLVLLALLLAGLSLWVGACSPDEPSSSTSSLGSGPATSGDIEAKVGDEIEVGSAIISVRALQSTFNPVSPEQRLSEQPPAAPEGNESFYQAYVKVENDGVTPIRVDAEDFACAVGDSVVGIEPTWSGPSARSLLKSSSIELLVTFKAQAGFEPVLLYSPPWYDGTIQVRPALTEAT